MKIAFAGKGGSGKTTMSSLFIQHISQNYSKNVWAVDADLNMHLAQQLGLSTKISSLRHISLPDSERDIKRYLMGKNLNIESVLHFKKSTPPTKNSNFIFPFKKEDYILQHYSVQEENLFLSIVGSYDTEGIGTSCYHNNLAVLESMLSHTIDINSTVVVDMVAGIDAFAGTLHAQFDMIVIVVEPTKKSIEVYEQYKQLAEKAKVWDRVFVLGNKIMSEKDSDFITSFIDRDKLLGFISFSNHIREMEQEDGILDVNNLEVENVKVFENTYIYLQKKEISFNQRLEKLYQLHNRYVGQGYIKDRFGDLTNQIDTTFNFDEFIKQYE